MRLYKNYYTYTINRAVFGKAPSEARPYYWAVIILGAVMGLIF